MGDAYIVRLPLFPMSRALNVFCYQQPNTYRFIAKNQDRQQLVGHQCTTIWNIDIFIGDVFIELKKLQTLFFGLHL